MRLTGCSLIINTSKQVAPLFFFKNLFSLQQDRPKNTWLCKMETEMRGLGHSWGSIQKLAEDRELWRSVDAALSAMVGLTGSE